MSDARFEDGGDAPLRLRVLDGDDLTVVAGLCQDAVLTAADLSFRAKARRFVILANRLRWEDVARAGARGRPVERVRSLIVIEDVLAARVAGIAPGDADTVLQLLEIAFDPEEGCGGRIRLVFAGDGEIELRVEALELVLRDVTRPYASVSGAIPDHGV